MNELININKATFEELQKIKYIGPVFAQAIIAGRRYKDVHELSKVDNIGKQRMARFLPYITV